MQEFYFQILNGSKFSVTSAFQTLFVAFSLMFTIWLAQYHWNRRNLYRMASKVTGPFSLPIFGNGLSFIGSTENILNVIVAYASKFPSPMRFWMGHKLYFLVWEPNDLQRILTSPYALQKEEVYRFAEPVVGTGLFTASVTKWKRHRKIIMPTFNQNILDGFVTVFSEKSDILAEVLKRRVGKGTFDIFHDISRCTLDIICETAMGVTVHAQTTDSSYCLWTGQAMEIIYRRMFNVLLYSDFIFSFTALSKDLNFITKKMNHFTGTVVKEKREAYQKKIEEQNATDATTFEEENEPRKRNSFLQQLIELSENGANFTDEELIEEVNTFMIAGSDTTATTNSFVMLMLGMFPDVQQKVYDEIIDALGRDRPIEHQDLGKLRYLEMVIKETMRLFPVGPIVVRKLAQDIKLESCTIPKNSSAVICIIKLHRSSKFWSDPFEFVPERFLPEEMANRHNYSWLPFSGGPRNCSGIKYALMTMKALVATVVRKYRISTEYKNIKDIKIKADLTLKPVDGYNVSLEFRN